MTFDKCLYLRGRLRLTTTRRLSAYMSSRALATTTTSSLFFKVVVVLTIYQLGFGFLFASYTIKVKGKR